MSAGTAKDVYKLRQVFVGAIFAQYRGCTGGFRASLVKHCTARHQRCQREELPSCSHALLFLLGTIVWKRYQGVPVFKDTLTGRCLAWLGGHRID